jgi:50S ribosomal subunit-associated GTPase HflX
MRDADYVFFDRKARERLRRHLGAPVVDRLGKLLDVYAVRARDGSVLTVAHRFKRIPHD